MRSVVKLYGAAIADEHGYGTGVAVSEDGLVVTVLSLLIETDNLRAVTHDGHIYRAEVLYRDNDRQLALLKLGRYPINVDTAATVRDQMTPLSLPVLTHTPSSAVDRGALILAIGNTFKVAEGAEPVTVLKGIVSGKTKLQAERGTQEFEYRGDVILLDAITSNPGTPGSAVIDVEGRWVGLVGKMVTSKLTNTYLNYAYPMEEVIAFLADAQRGADPQSRPAATALVRGYHGIKLSKIAYRRRLPFVQSVARGSPAEQAGVEENDLIISANGTAIPQARAFTELCERLRPGDELALIVKRGEVLVNLRLTLTEPPE
jgi:serine protease Do